jgi:hypothetical protein
MNELLHRASAILEPVWTRLLDVVRVRPVVGADEAYKCMPRFTGRRGAKAPARGKVLA